MKRIVLTKEFQKDIFEELLDKFSRKKLEKTLGINSASIYHMKNYKIASLNLENFDKIAKLLELPDMKIKKNTIKFLSEREALRGLEIGRNYRKNQLENWRKEIPKVSDLIQNNKINVEKWFNSYVKLINFGSRQFKSVEKVNNKLILKYTNYVKGEKRKFKTILPRQINIDDKFIYFFGLWCGDKAGGGRLGVCNKAPEINIITESYLKTLHQKIVFQMLLTSKINYTPLTKVRIDKVQIVRNMPGDHVMVVFSINGILKTFFDYLLENLNEFLDLITNKNIFFAGLFDAEGNVSLEDKYFRWACKNGKRIEIYKKHLKQMNMFRRYDGASLITDNRQVFLEKIYPYLKHQKKINRINLLFHNFGHLEHDFIKILETINSNPGIIISDLNKKLNKKKMWPKIKFLIDTGHVEKEGYPMKLYVTKKGLTESRREGQ
ncbi:MAG: hypothetical protein HYU56_04680 [Candidatus Aenigmarchaeota archaeon]|nr:hypothetical protein [Candidatus Aenigmarchaeota archaeon]